MPPLLTQWVESAAFEPLAPPVQPGWTRFNPTLVARDGVITIGVRSANYRMTAEGRYEVEGGVIRSETIVGTLTSLGLAGRGAAGSTMTSPGPLNVVPTREPSSFPVQGWEDVRLFARADRLAGLATVRNVDDGGICRIALLLERPDGHFDEVLVQSPQPHRHEKNWAPWPVDDLVRAVYSWDPLRIVLIDPLTGGTTLTTVGPTGLGGSARGGSGAVQVSADEWLFIVHESHTLPDGRAYLHRFVTIDKNGVIMRASPRMRLRSLGIEFVAGAARLGDELIIAFGVDDREAWLARMPLASVLNRMDALAPLARAGS